MKYKIVSLVFILLGLSWELNTDMAFLPAIMIMIGIGIGFWTVRDEL